MSISMFKLQT